MAQPNEPLRAPYPNVIIPGWPRVALHVITVAKASNVAAIDATKSSSGTSVTDVANGAILNFPAGGTGAIGFVVPAARAEASPAGGMFFAVDSDTTTNFATGTALINTFQDAGGDGTVEASDGDFICTFLVFVLLGPGGAV